MIGALALSGPAEGIVLPHEDVMAHVVEDRADLMRATAAHLEPLLLTYRSDGDAATGATAVVERTVGRTPLLDTTTEDGFCHRLWAVTDPAERAEIEADLLRHQALIADGHHRWATYLRLQQEHTDPGPWDYGLVLLVDTARYPLRVRAIHRLLHGLPVADALAALAGLFRIREVAGPLPRALDALADSAGEGNAFLLMRRRGLPSGRPPGRGAAVPHGPGGPADGLAHARRDGPALGAARPRVAHPGRPGAHRLHPRHRGRRGTGRTARLHSGADASRTRGTRPGPGPPGRHHAPQVHVLRPEAA